MGLDDGVSTANKAGGGVVEYGDKVKILSEHVKTVLTLSSASLPVIVALLGMLAAKDAAGQAHIRSFLQSAGLSIEASLGFFLVSIIAGVVYSYLLCKDVNQPNAFAGELDVTSIVMHGAFLFGVGAFLWFAYQMVQFLRS